MGSEDVGGAGGVITLAKTLRFTWLTKPGGVVAGGPLGAGCGGRRTAGEKCGGLRVEIWRVKAGMTSQLGVLKSNEDGFESCLCQSLRKNSNYRQWEGGLPAGILGSQEVQRSLGRL